MISHITKLSFLLLLLQVVSSSAETTTNVTTQNATETTNATTTSAPLTANLTEVLTTEKTLLEETDVSDESSPNNTTTAAQNGTTTDLPQEHEDAEEVDLDNEPELEPSQPNTTEANEENHTEEANLPDEAEDQTETTTTTTTTTDPVEVFENVTSTIGPELDASSEASSEISAAPTTEAVELEESIEDQRPSNSTELEMTESEDSQSSPSPDPVEAFSHPEPFTLTVDETQVANKTDSSEELEEAFSTTADTGDEEHPTAENDESTPTTPGEPELSAWTEPVEVELDTGYPTELDKVTEHQEQTDESDTNSTAADEEAIEFSLNYIDSSPDYDVPSSPNDRDGGSVWAENLVYPEPDRDAYHPDRWPSEPGRPIKMDADIELQPTQPPAGAYESYDRMQPEYTSHYYDNPENRYSQPVEELPPSDRRPVEEYGHPTTDELPFGPNDFMLQNNSVQTQEDLYDESLPRESPVSHGSYVWRVRQARTQPRSIACSQPLNRGEGPDETNAWFFNMQTGRCEWFAYGGFGGNANRFYSRQACENLCVNDIANPCDDVDCNYSYTLQCKTVSDESCERYHGGNAPTECPPAQPVCMTRRNVRIPPIIRQDKVPRECREPMDPGACMRKDPTVMYYYDPEQNICQAFYYHRCAGNNNRFITKAACMNYCSP